MARSSKITLSPARNVVDALVELAYQLAVLEKSREPLPTPA